MVNWIKEHWFGCVIGLIIAILVVGQMDSCVSKIQYKRQIKAFDQSIADKEKKIEASEGRVEGLWKKVEKNEDRIAKRDERIKEKDKEIVSIRKERDSWKGKVEEMTPSEVVIETREVLNCANLFERPDGILFTLDCARINLRGLKTGEFSLAMPDIKALEEKVAEQVGNIADLKTEVGDLKEMVIEKDGIIVDERGISKDWEGKFDNSEDRRKRARGKGRKEGGIVGGAIVLIFWIALGR